MSSNRSSAITRYPLSGYWQAIHRAAPGLSGRTGVYKQYRPMPSPNDNAVYNSRIAHMRAWLLRFSRAACFLVLLLMHAPVIFATDWRAPEEQLARKIAAATGPGAAALDLLNRSSLSRTDVEEIRRGLLSELATLGVRLVNADQAAATVQITLSENLRDYVWV